MLHFVTSVEVVYFAALVVECLDLCDWWMVVTFVWQELNLREDELNKLLNQQKAHERELQRREELLRIRELELLEREINMMIRQQTQMPTKPMPERRKGKFRKSRLKQLLKSGGMTISEPSGQYLIVDSSLNVMDLGTVYMGS